MNVPITWTSITALVIAAVGTATGLARLLAESLLKEKVKSAFDRKLEEHKAALDLVKQQALNEAKSELDHKLENHKTTLELLKQQSLKDFGLFAEKKHQVNTAVYSALRTAYKTVNQSLRGWRTPVQVELYSAEDLEQFLTSQGVATDERRDLAMLHEISPSVSSMEVNRRMGGFLLNQAQEALVAAQELTYTNELFLSPEVISCCDSVLALLTQAIAGHAEPEKLDAALDAIPRALWHLMASMRMDLLGNQGRDSEPTTYRKEDGRMPLLQNLPTSIQFGDITDFEEKIGRLASRGLDMVGFPAHASVGNPDADKQQLALVNERLGASPDDPALRLARGRLLLKCRRAKDAMVDAHALLKDNPDNLDALLLSTDCHLALPFRDSFSRRLRLINEVIGPLTRYLEKSPNDGRTL